jgi:hyperosmotically inducible periplasmic protein
MRKLFALVVLVGLGLALYFWKYQPRRLEAPQVPASARDAVESAGEKTRDALGNVGEKTREALGNVGDKLRETKIAGQVKAALELNRDLAPYAISVSAPEPGVVVLQGSVPRDDLRRRAEEISAAVPEVRRVTNQLQVAPGTPPAGDSRTLGENLDDKALQAKLHLAFSLRRELEGTNIDVSAYRKEVTLGGEVGSDAQRALAEEVARQTTAVASVKNEIRVRGALPATAVAGNAASPSDRVRAVERALQANRHLASLGLKARAEGTTVVLEGNVRADVEKDLAEALAREAAGGPVRNDIQIRP